MINNLQISGVHAQADEKVRKYVYKKIGGLDKYIPRKARESAFADVKLKEIKSKTKEIFECEVIMKLPKGKITAHKSSASFMGAIDEVENNLKNQLKKYKDMHTPSRFRRRVLTRFKRTAAAENLF